MREAARFRRRVKHLHLVPIHIGKSVAGPCHDYSAAARSLARKARKRSASSAAMQPRPAAVTACRQISSATSPAANTPGTEVAVEFGATSTYPDGFSLIWPRMSSVAGACPIAMKTPSAGSSVSLPVLTFFNLIWVTLPGFSVPQISSMALSQTTLILGFLNSRSCRMRSARKWSRRCTMVTCEAKLVRNIASSTAVLPPPAHDALLAAIEKSVAGRARRHAKPLEFLFRRRAEPARLRAGGEDHRFRKIHIAAVAGQAERPPRELELGGQ